MKSILLIMAVSASLFSLYSSGNDEIFPQMVLVEKGSFIMGRDSGAHDERPAHEVSLTRDFFISAYETTFAQYDLFCVETGRSVPPDRGFGRDDRPVMAVDWVAATEYCNWLSSKAGLTPCYSGSGTVIRCDFEADGYRLPTEAEWEYAARGGRISGNYRFSGSDSPLDVAWFKENSEGMTHPVGQKKPNELGLYDMSGNAFEWCWDWYGEDYYSHSAEENPSGPSGIPKQIARGPEKARRSGSWRESAENVSVYYRSIDNIYYPGENGLRLVRTVKPE